MFTSILFAIPLLAPQGSTIWVPDDHALIQDALLAAQSGDTVVVRAGTYYEYELNFGGKDILMTSEDGAEVTMVDGSSILPKVLQRCWMGSPSLVAPPGMEVESPSLMTRFLVPLRRPFKTVLLPIMLAAVVAGECIFVALQLPSSRTV